jgi:murein DD-endopeptidase MepM/ murein hydrolase activator NlpD
VDPALEEYLDREISMGGIYNSTNIGLYTYVQHNPLVLHDPDGRFTNPLDTMVLRSHVSGRHRPIGSGFGMVRTNTNNQPKPHQGLDLRALNGTSTFAVGNGKITHIDRTGSTKLGKRIMYEFTYKYSFGNFLYDLFTFNWGSIGDKIENSGKKFVAMHAHLESIDSNLQVGMSLKEGQEIGKTGSSGNASGLRKGERHLHFEMRTKTWSGGGLQNRVDPARFTQGLNRNPKDNRSNNPDDWE